MKILFVIDKLNTGGVSSSLINLLKQLKGKEECYILIFSGKKDYNNIIDNDIKIITPPLLLKILGASQREIFKESIILGVLRLFLVFLSRIFSGYISRKILFSLTKTIKCYDVAISYTHDVGWKSLTTGCNQFVAEKVDAKIKISFVHCDYTRFGGYNKKQLKIYNMFDYIMCVSDACKYSFINCFPTLNEKTRVLENFIDPDMIEKMSYDAYIYDIDKCNIVTVCRLTEEKGISRAIDVFNRIIGDGVTNFSWTIVGDGKERDNLEKKVSQYGLEKNIKFVGETTNPFYYMKNASLFLLPSFHEAAPMVFSECREMRVPILTTETISAKDLVEKRGAGIVCENTEKGIYESLKMIIQNNIITKSLNFNNPTNLCANLQLNSLIEDLHNQLNTYN